MRRILAVKLSQVILVGRAHVHLGLAMGTPSLLRCCACACVTTFYRYDFIFQKYLGTAVPGTGVW